MTDEPQGPKWWQASDLKWYPTEQHPDYVASLPPPPKLPPPPTPVTPTQSPVTTTGPSGARKVWFVLAGLALLAFAVLVVEGVEFKYLPHPLVIVVMIAVVIIGVTIAVRSGHSGADKVVFVIATVLVAVAVPLASNFVVYTVFLGNGSASGVARSSNNSSFCPDFLKLWDGSQGVWSAIMAVQEADAAKEYRAHGWSNTALLTAATHAETLAAEAPSDQLKTDFTNIAQTLKAHANLDLTYHGTGNEALEVNASTLTARCRIQGSSGH